MLQVHGLCKAYGAATILHNISFTLNPGEHVGLIGPNGAGKSTLLRIITGRETPDAGQIMRAPQLRLGYLAQDFADQPAASVGTILSAAQATWSAAALGLEQATQALTVAQPGELDAALATYAAAEATYDEPVNHLDLNSREQFEQALEAFEGTVLVVSHDRAFVEAYAERTIRLGAGDV